MHAEWPRLVAERLERRDDERAACEIVGAAQIQLRAAALERRQIEDGPVPDRQRPGRANVAVAGRPVRHDRVVHVPAAGRPVALRHAIAMDDERERPAEVARVDPAAEPRLAARAIHLDELEARMIGVRDERQRAFGMAAREVDRQLSVRVASRNESDPLQLRRDRVERAPLVIRDRRWRCDAFERRDDLTLVRQTEHRSRGYRPTRVLRLYDSRRRAIHAVRPRGRVLTMYVCGVTPYDTTHLGHARTFLVFDLVARLLEATGQPVRYVQNVTDIDESILQRAGRDRVGWRELGRRETRAYLDDMRRLGWRRPDVIAYATRELPAMRALIRTLERKGAAYRLPRGVYFPVAKDRRYGELSRLSPPAMRRILARQDDAALEDPGRRDTRDFALWRTVHGGPTWPSPHGRGRPGWHLECSAMIRSHLGDQIDLHGGGADLIYPHHENEIAQSETATGKRPFVRTWVHVAAMELGGKKMSKSDGNMVFVRDVLEKTDPRALRWYLLERHYRTRFDHDEALLDRTRLRQKALAAALGRGRIGPLGRDRDTKAALAALEHDLDVRRALAFLERAAPRADATTRASLRAVARIVGVA